MWLSQATQVFCLLFSLVQMVDFSLHLDSRSQMCLCMHNCTCVQLCMHIAEPVSCHLSTSKKVAPALAPLLLLLLLVEPAPRLSPAAPGQVQQWRRELHLVLCEASKHALSCILESKKKNYQFLKKETIMEQEEKFTIFNASSMRSPHIATMQWIHTGFPKEIRWPKTIESLWLATNLI